MIGWAQNWEMALQPGTGLVFWLPAAPNVLHRALQRLALGITWKLGKDAPA
jgi:hypothetical protein